MTIIKNVLGNVLVFCIVLFVGSELLSKFSYNLLVQNGTKRWFIFIQHPIKYALYRGRFEK